jgi:hypothetical protein
MVSRSINLDRQNGLVETTDQRKNEIGMLESQPLTGSFVEINECYFG